MASSMGGDFAQAYLMRKLHKEKMEKLMQQEKESKARPSSSTNNKKKKKNEANESSNGFFGLMRKKVHPSGVNSGEAGAAVAGDV